MRHALAALALLAVFLALPRLAAAQSTTTAVTTSSTTTTTLPNIATCVADNNWVFVNAPYEASGHCTFTHYQTSGMRLTTANTLHDAGQALCASFARIPVNVLFGVGHVTTTGYNFFWDSTNRKIWCFTGGTECSAALDLSAARIYFRAVCK